MYQPSFEKARAIAETGKYKRIPMSREIYSDMKTPVEVLKILQNISGHCFLLESAEDTKRWGHYTFLGFDPVLELTCTDGVLKVKTGTEFTQETDHPDEYITKLINENKAPRFDYLPPFAGGLAGYFSYDYIKYAEPVLDLESHGDEDFRDIDLMLFDKIIAFDNYRQKIVLIANIRTEDIETEYNRGKCELDNMVNLLKNGKTKNISKSGITSEIKNLFSKEEYCEMVERAKKYIFEGDIFQVVLSNRMEADFKGSLLDTYRVLRTLNPSPYMFYFSGDDTEIAGASPETLVKLEDGILHTFPLAGTRPRGEDYEEDVKLEKELLADEKEKAEHNMLVDLGRNDLGRISRFGTVEVEKYMSVEKFSHVMHLGSAVRGEIREDKTAVDAVNAVLPAGTLSGAPKIRACEIIHELEGNKRGIYGGAVGYLDFAGNLDTCIAIRLAYKKNGKVYIRSGAGIVADSVPEKEYQECLNKAKAVLKALEEAEGGLDR